MTAQQAKEESLLVWRYLAEHPDITHKIELSNKIWRIISCYTNKCPLCEYYVEIFYSRFHNSFCKCNMCPLKNCSDDGALYHKWQHSETDKERKLAAEAIVKAIEEWEV